MRLAAMTSIFGKGASIVLPRTPPRTPTISEPVIDTSTGSWLKGLGLFLDQQVKEDQISLLANNSNEAHIVIQNEKAEIIDRPDVLFTDDSQWITYADIAKMGNLPYLSGMRAVASIAIQIYHLVKPASRSASYFGCFGLSVHFVQGAFLITGALLQLQKANQGKSILSQHSHLPRFFFGRWVRLYPALLVVIIITSIWWQKRYDNATHLAKAIFRAVFKIQHTKIFDIPDRPPNPFAHTWFLDVQEAFYLTWALALPFIVMLGTIPRMILLIVLSVFSFRRRLKETLFNAALSINMWKMVAGVALQLIPIPRSFVHQYATMFAIVVLVLGSLWGSSAYLNDNYSDKWKRVHGDVAGVICTFAVILASFSNKSLHPARKQVTPTTDTMQSKQKSTIALMLSYILSPLSILNAKWLDFIGRISYSWYLWQIPVMHYEAHFMAGYPSLGSTCEAFILAMISTFFFEEPIRDWYRDRLKRSRVASMIAKQEVVPQ